VPKNILLCPDNHRHTKNAILIPILSFILTRRYTINVKGVHLLQDKGAKLFLQNHQSHLDPQLLGVYIARYCDFVPVISERFLKIPVLGAILRAWDAVAVSDLKHGNRDPHVLEKIFSGVIKALKQGKSVLIAPSGQIAHTPVEKIKNKQSAHLLVSNLPDNVKVIGVRVSGLWGSMWSVAWMGKNPNFLYTFLKGIVYLFANFIFFLPKRPVTFEFVDLTEEAILKAKEDRKTFNHYLEEFYNVNGAEQATYLKHFFYFPKMKRHYPANLASS